MIKKIICYTFLLCIGFFLYSQETPMQDEHNILPEEFLKLLGQEEEILDEYQKEMTVSINSLILNLNPHTSSFLDEAQILNSLYEGLFSYNYSTAEPDKGLINEYKTSRDKKYWIFSLRTDAKFSDGSAITSQVIKDAWLDLISNPEANYASFLDIIKGARNYRLGTGTREQVAIFANDDYTFSLELESPISHLPGILCHHAFAAVTKEQDKYSGPYKLTHISDSEIILEKNEYYYDVKNVRIPKIKIIGGEDTDEISMLFNTGKIQWIAGTHKASQILDKNAIKLERIFGITYYFFKTDNSPYLTEKVRQAILDATPWEQLRYGSIFPATTYVFPLSGYKQPSPLDFTDYAYANNLMKEAKKELGLKETDVIDLTFVIPQGTEIYQSAQMLKNAWAHVGVNLNIEVSKYQNYFTSIQEQKTDLVIYTWIGDFADPIAFLELFRSDSTMNDSHWKNTEFDQFLDKANLTMDKQERFDYLSKAEDILLSSAMVLPVCFSIDMHTVNTNELGGWANNPLNIHPFKAMYFKKNESSYNFGIVAKNY